MHVDDIYRFLATRYGYTPFEISQMTPPQQWMMINVDGGRDKRTGKATIKFKNMDDFRAWQQSRGM